MKRLIIVALILFPMMSWAEYDHQAIKSQIDDSKAIFEVVGWRQTDNGEAWVASTKVENMVLTVGVRASGMIASIADAQQASPALIRCLSIGIFGLSPENKAQREMIGEVVMGATQGQASKIISMNGVTFEVKPTVVVNNVVLSCALAPDNAS